MSVTAGNKFEQRKTFTLCMLLFFLLPLNALGGATEKESTIKPAKLFTTNEPISITISAPWRDIERKERYQGTYPAKIEFTDELGNTTSLPVTVERRGRTRQSVCRFPPIKLRFDKKAGKGTSFRGQKSLKMVTHCQSNSRFEQLYILEMLAYRMYNIITDFSFRVRPLSVTYVDNEREDQRGPKFAFLIEDDSDVARRNGQKKLNIAKTTKKRLDSQESTNFALFQYMISNLDWSALSGPDKNKCCHNAKLIGQDPTEDPIYSIPYDFDAAGLVDAPYATPPANLRVNKVTQRLFRGFCVHNGTMEDSRQRFLGNEQAILALVSDESLLNSSTKKRAMNYLDKFFDILKDERKFQRKIIAKCRK
jgi:hypothetical protein